ncbi:MAG: glycosyl transferase [Rhodobacterales bacterium]|nr:MAG: glycosyl transferase [Rhodobacterales bacterium]
MPGEIEPQSEGLRDVQTTSLPGGYPRLVTNAPGCPVDLVDTPPDPTLLALWRAERALHSEVLPWRRIGGQVIALGTSPRALAKARPDLEHLFGPVRSGHISRLQLQTAVAQSAQAHLSSRAETRTAERLSCRNHKGARFGIVACGVAALIGLAAWIAPTALLITVCVIAVAASMAGTGLKILASLTFLWHSRRTPPAPLPDGAPLPAISILVPLYREQDIAAHLLKRLARLVYPRDKIELWLVVEQDDLCTQRSIAQTELPAWIHPITVPPGTCRTKPRAMNYALDFCRGDVVGVFDAEDAPDPDQLLTVARRFAQAAPDVACLQGVLDYYNARSNWLARCFTLEYATWFRVMLPGLERLGLVLPLGGTTVFFKRDVLEEVGAWDAQNVTEDADLGIRLARAGYRTEMIDSTTYEEANARLWPWIKQRSRWLKGYAITYMVHMRAPLQLWRDLGAKRFLGVQVQFGATLLTFTLTPVLWSFWLGIFGIPHPFLEALPKPALWMMAGVFLMGEVANISVAAWAAARAGQRDVIRWAPTLHLYFPLAAFALYKGLWELAAKPFYWDKTSHGIFAPTGQARARRWFTSRRLRRSSTGS